MPDTGAASAASPPNSPSPGPNGGGAPAGSPPAAASPAASTVSVVSQPNLVKPEKRGGLAGILDEIADGIAGTKGPGRAYTDKDGNQYIEHPTLSRKGQWLKIASEAVHGAAAGAAHMQGPGAAGRGFAAGVNAGDQMAEQERQRDQQQSQEARQANQDNFNQIKLKHDLAAKEFELSRLKVQANESDIKFSQEQDDRMRKLVGDGKAFDLGIYKDEADLARIKQVNPNFWKDVYKNDITVVPELGENGERKGIHVYQTTPGVGNEIVEAGTSFKVFTPGARPGQPPVLTDQVPTVPMTWNQKHAYDVAAAGQMQKYQIAQKGEELKQSEIEKNRAEAGKARQETQAAGPSDPALVDGIGTGQIAPENLSRMLGGKQGEKLLDDVKSKYPEVDTSRLASYPRLYVDFTSGKTSQQRQNLDTAFKAVADLANLNTYASRMPTGGARNAWDKRLNDASQEIANALTKPGANATEGEIKGVKASLSPVFSRQPALDKQIDTLMDQYESMRQRWKEGAPSAVFEGHMPDIGAQTKAIMYRHDPARAEGWFGKPVFASAPGKPRLLSFDGGKTWQPGQ